MAKKEVVVTVKDLRAALSMAENLVNAAHEALEGLPERNIRVRSWVWDALEIHPPVDGGLKCLTPQGRDRRKKKALRQSPDAAH